MTPSVYQQAIYDAVANTEDNIIIQACAGSGKTTTLKEICDRLPSELKIVALCFTKSNAEDFQKKLPRHVEASTMHRLGRSTLLRHLSPFTFDIHKQEETADRLFGSSRTLSFSGREARQRACALTPLIRS